MNNIDIKILLSSDFNYEKIVAEIYYKEKFVALINQDEGLDNLIIEFPDSTMEDNMIIRKLNFSVLEKGLILAKQALQEQ